MQQTDKYKLNLIETSDTFSPAPLNENMEKVEAAIAAGDAAEASARAAAISSEAQARTAAINSEAQARASADTAETNARIAAINSEASTRAAAIKSETQARTAAINSEAQTRANADTAETNARIAAINSEASTRAAAVSALDTRVKVLEAHKFVVGYAATTGTVTLGATPKAVIAYNNFPVLITEGHSHVYVKIVTGGFSHTNDYAACSYIAFL